MNKITDPSRLKMYNNNTRLDRSYHDIHKVQTSSRSHDRTNNRHCFTTKVGEKCVPITHDGNAWKKDQSNYYILQTTKTTYRLMTEEIRFLKLLKVLDRLFNKHQKQI